MKRSDLEHIIRAAGDLLGEDEVIIVGSQAILATFSEEQPPPLASRSLEADVMAIDDVRGEKANLISGVLGELSFFDESFGILADGLLPGTAVLPIGWRDRLIPYRNANTNGVTGLCLEVHDLCASKLVAFRDKDRQFVTVLARAGIADVSVLAERIAQTDVAPELMDVIRTFLVGISTELD